MLYVNGSGDIVSTGTALSGQILIGGTGTVPALNYLTGTNGISIVDGVNSIVIDGSEISSNTVYIENSGSATAIDEILNLLGGTGISTYGDGTSTIYFNLETPVIINSDYSMLYVDGNGDIVSTGTALDGQILIGGTGTIPALNTLTAGTGINVTNSVNSVTIANSTSGGVNWVFTSVTTGVSMSVSTGYVSTSNSGTVVLILPTTADQGTVIWVAGYGTAGWQITQPSAGQVIHFGTMDTTTGTGGYLASINRYDAVQLLCVVANAEWLVISSAGNILVN